jgi:hypothetical protein
MVASENQLDFPKILDLLKRRYLYKEDFSLKVRALQVCVPIINALNISDTGDQKHGMPTREDIKPPFYFTLCCFIIVYGPWMNFIRSFTH